MLQHWPWPSSLYWVWGSGSGPVGHVSILQKALCPLALHGPTAAVRGPLGLSTSRERRLCSCIKTEREDFLCIVQVLQLYCNWKKEVNGNSAAPLSYFLKACYFMETSWMTHKDFIIKNKFLCYCSSNLQLCTKFYKQKYHGLNIQKIHNPSMSH